jgi:hypothetical protein
MKCSDIEPPLDSVWIGAGSGAGAGGFEGGCAGGGLVSCASATKIRLSKKTVPLPSTFS